jgi:ABC-type Fe3+/spermidine/putrescine transport system ATPase subunit
MTAAPHIEVEDLVIRYGAVQAVGPVSFQVKVGEQMTLLGPSGCGKTTTLRAVAGLEKPHSGRIRVGGRVMFDGEAGINLPAEERGLSMVFQSYAIWPHMTVFENVAYGLRVRRKSQAEIQDRVRQALALVKMEAFADRHASQLSGGQQQRVAVARACAFSPSVLLFDEPLSNLDAKLRGNMRIELRELQHRLGVTSLYVTHDLEEALAMSDQILVMNAGHIEQHGSPDAIYNSPRTTFVADFVGSSNLIRGKVLRERSSADIVVIEADGGEVIHAATCGRQVGDQACLSVRTVHLDIADAASTPPRHPNHWPATIQRSVFLGDLTQIHVVWGGRELIIRRAGPQHWQEGQQVMLSADPAHCTLLEDN